MTTTLTDSTYCLAGAAYATGHYMNASRYIPARVWLTRIVLGRNMANTTRPEIQESPSIKACEEWCGLTNYDEEDLEGAMSDSDCYDYVRRHYNVPAYVGMRVRVGGNKLGVIVKCNGAQQQYIKIQLIGDSQSYLYHPEYGIEYIVEGTEPVSRKW